MVEVGRDIYHVDRFFGVGGYEKVKDQEIVESQQPAGTHSALSI